MYQILIVFAAPVRNLHLPSKQTLSRYERDHDTMGLVVSKECGHLISQRDGECPSRKTRSEG